MDALRAPQVARFHLLSQATLCVPGTTQPPRKPHLRPAPATMAK